MIIPLLGKCFKERPDTFNHLGFTLHAYNLLLPVMNWLTYHVLGTLRVPEAEMGPVKTHNPTSQWSMQLFLHKAQKVNDSSVVVLVDAPHIPLLVYTPHRCTQKPVVHLLPVL